MTIPLIVLAVLSVAGGFLNTPHFLHLGTPQWLAGWFGGIGATGAPVIPLNEMHLPESTEWSLMIFTTSLAVAIIAGLYFVYTSRTNLPVADSAQTGLTGVVANKFYVDEIYDFLFVKPLEKLSKLFHYYLDIQAIDGLVNGVGSAVQWLGSQFRKMQNGNIEYYLLGMVAGAVLLLLTLFVHV